MDSKEKRKHYVSQKKWSHPLPPGGLWENAQIIFGVMIAEGTGALRAFSLVEGKDAKNFEMWTMIPNHKVWPCPKCQ